MSRYSPYMGASRIFFNEGDEILSPNLITPESQQTQQTHLVKEGETLASISYQEYGDSGYWGDIAAYNKMLDIFEELVPGMTLYIP